MFGNLGFCGVCGGEWLEIWGFVGGVVEDGWGVGGRVVGCVVENGWKFGVLWGVLWRMVGNLGFCGVCCGEWLEIWGFVGCVVENGWKFGVLWGMLWRMV